MWKPISASKKLKLLVNIHHEARQSTQTRNIFFFLFQYDSVEMTPTPKSLLKSVKLRTKKIIAISRPPTFYWGSKNHTGDPREIHIGWGLGF